MSNSFLPTPTRLTYQTSETVIVNHPNLKNKLALPSLATVFFALAFYFALQLAPLPLSEYFLLAPQNWPVALQLTALGLSLSVAFIVVRVVGELVFFLFRKRKGYEAPSLLRDIFSLVAYAAGITIILKSFFPAISFGALLSGSALLGIILGLALQDTLGNLFAGVSLHADKPFQVGDVITVGKWVGTVESITWRAVKLRTFQNHVVMVSNSQVSKESIEVCPRGNANARLVSFGASYTESPVRVTHVVREALREVDNVLRYMTPIVRVRNLGESSIEYEVKYWLDDYARYNDTDALVRQRIWYAFSRAGMHFPYPMLTLNIERRAANGKPPIDGLGIVERLSTVDIFAPLTGEELKLLARSVSKHVFAPGETIIRAGDEGASMFVVHEGRVEVKVVQKGEMRTLGLLHDGDFFGEMALFTGEPRTAHVIAAEETTVLEIGYEAMKHLFDTNPDLVESLGQTIAERRAGLRVNAAVVPNQENGSAGLLASIKRFFKIK